MSNNSPTAIPFFEEILGSRARSKHWKLEEVVRVTGEDRPLKLPNEAFWGTSGIDLELRVRCHICFKEKQESDPLLKLPQSIGDWDDYMTKGNCYRCGHKLWGCGDCRVIAISPYVGSIFDAFITFDGIDRSKDAPGFRISLLYGDMGLLYQDIYGDGEQPFRKEPFEIDVSQHQSSNFSRTYTFAHCCECNLPKEDLASWLFYCRESVKHRQMSCLSNSCQHNPWRCSNCIRLLAYTFSQPYDGLFAKRYHVMWVFPDSFSAGRPQLLQNPLFRASAELNPHWRLISSQAPALQRRPSAEIKERMNILNYRVEIPEPEYGNPEKFPPNNIMSLFNDLFARHLTENGTQAASASTPLLTKDEAK